MGLLAKGILWLAFWAVILWHLPSILVFLLWTLGGFVALGLIVFLCAFSLALLNGK